MQGTAPTPTLLTTEQAGELLGLSARAMEERRRRGDGPPYVRFSSRCVRYRLQDLNAWLEARTFTSTAQEAAQGPRGDSHDTEQP